MHGQNETLMSQRLQEAAAKAGVPPLQQARLLVHEAMVAHPGSDGEAVEHLLKALKRKENAFALRAVVRVFYEEERGAAREEARLQEAPRREPERGSGAGHATPGDQGGSARPASPLVDVRKHERRPPNSLPPGGANTPTKARRPERDLSAMDAVVEVARLTFLDTHRVNGVPIGDLTPRELLKASSASSRDARFYARVAGNLPMDDLVRKWADPDDVKRMWDEEHSASLKERADVDAY